MPDFAVTSKLPSVEDFLANQGPFIDANIMMTVIGEANAQAISAAIVAKASQLSGHSAKALSAAETQGLFSGAFQTIIKPDVDAATEFEAQLESQQAQNPLPATGSTPNLDSWDADHPLTYSPDALAQFLASRGLPVAVYVPAQSKTVEVPNPNSAVPPTITQTLTAPQIGTPNAFEVNAQTLAAYSQSLKSASADNPEINNRVANSAQLAGLASALTASGVATPAKLTDFPDATLGLVSFGRFATSAADQSRSELFALVNKSAETFEFLSNLAEDLARISNRQTDKLQEKLSASSSLDIAEFAELDPQTRTLVEDALSKLSSVSLQVDAQAELARLPADEKREALRQISSFQKSIETLVGDNAPPAAAPSYQPSARMTRV